MFRYAPLRRRKVHKHFRIPQGNFVVRFNVAAIDAARDQRDTTGFEAMCGPALHAGEAAMRMVAIYRIQAA